MSSHMRVRHDRDVNAIYIELRQGKTARTVEAEESIYMDLDAAGRPLGIEFVHAEDFFPYMSKARERLGIPESLLDQQQWAVS